MGMRCELFGHDFGASKIEESYDEGERGTVLTVREYRSCQRCGYIRNISENHGLISTIEESDANDGLPDKAEYSAETRQPVERQENAADETEATDRAQAAEPDPTESPESAPTAPDTVGDQPSDTEVSDASTTETPSTPPERTDDAVILSESEPQEPADAGTTPLNSDDAVIIDAATDTPHSPSETSEGPDSRNDRDRSTPTADDGENTTTDSDPTYTCPRCAFELPVSESSFFAGDVCPQCRVGYLEDTVDSES
ncbi:DUF7093 family protein [Haloarcula marismortui]|uniref:DUF7093 family protein n=1 Tax=Haloarcula TaxID=2237 RepID=UPI000EF17946|nr:hypothetical protein [Haloarcula sp. Atlit-47R]RLM44209.1 hypothetical protein DVK00_14275 [Haloarcula sp. Atlit-47R]